MSAPFPCIKCNYVADAFNLAFTVLVKLITRPKRKMVKYHVIPEVMIDVPTITLITFHRDVPGHILDAT